MDKFLDYSFVLAGVMLIVISSIKIYESKKTKKESPKTIVLPNGKKATLININNNQYYYYEDYHKIILIPNK